MSIYLEEIRSFQKKRNQDIRQPNGWLSVVGIYWLQEGVNTCGESEDNNIKLRCGHQHCFVVHVDQGSVLITALEGVAATISGTSLTSSAFNHDESDQADIVMIGDLSIELLRRNSRFALRVRDRKNSKRDTYPELQWFDINPIFRVEGTFVRHAFKKTIDISIALGGEYALPNPGKVVFQIDGKTMALEAVRQGQSNSLFLIFKDKTNGIDSYGAGRFLIQPFHYPDQTETPVTIDFNRAVSPPCAYTNAATCPLPPTENSLPVAVPAGEKYDRLSTDYL